MSSVFFWLLLTLSGLVLWAVSAIIPTMRWGLLSVWHHRILGGLWALVAMFAFGNICLHALPHADAEQAFHICIAILVAGFFIVASVGLVFGQTWARRIMVALMLLTILLALDLILMAGFVGNKEMLYTMLVVLGLAVYTLGFLATSAFYHA